MTYYLLVFYGVVKVCLIIDSVRLGAPLVDVMPKMWGTDDMVLLSGVVNYWILDRTLAKRGI
jgi:hypothetical protein